MKYAAAMALIVTASPVVAQSFYLAPPAEPHPPNHQQLYDRECCSNRDCQPLSEEMVSTNARGEWHVRYINWAGKLVDADVPPNKIKVSRDGRFHACSTEAGSFLCFYIPLSG